MSFPYKVKVVKNDKDNISVTILPQPVATKEEYIPLLSKTFQNILISPKIQNTITGRMRLKKQLEDKLKEFHNQGIIKPKEDDKE